METIHLSRLSQVKAKKYSSRTAILYRDYSLSKWVEMTWAEMSDRIDRIARAISKFGIKEQDRVGICSQNMPQAIIADLANLANRGISVPMYATLSSQQMEFIIDDAQIELLFVGEQVQYDNALEAFKSCPSLRQIVVFDEGVDLRGESRAMRFSDFMNMGNDTEMQSVVDRRRKEASDDDIAIIMYTSGTTGQPKGVMIMHYNLIEIMRIHDERLTKVNKKDTSMAFLPMTHIFERAWTYFCLWKDVKVYINLRPADIQKTIKEVRPTLLCSVPRFWEKIAAGVQEKIDTFSPMKKAMVTWALAVGRDYNLNYRLVEKRASFRLYCNYKFANRFIFSVLKKIVGIDRGRLFPVSGAALDDNLSRFFLSLGLPIYYGYGLTETCATVSCYPDKNFTIGSLGTLMPDVQVKIGDDDEILVKGRTVTPGYYNRPDINQESFVDGWFRTGDAGRLEGNTLYMVDRIKDLFKTSNGKYIAPQQIETTLGGDRYIEQVIVIGNNRNYVTAIIAPNLKAIEAYAQSKNITYDRIEDLLANTEVHQLIEQHIAEGQKNMAPFEKIKKFHLIKQGFTIESGEMTSTLKLRRAVIQQHYAAIIDEMYDGVPGTLLQLVK